MDFNFMVCKVAHRLRRNWPALPADGVLQMESASSCLGSTQSTSTAVRGSTHEWGLYTTGLQSVLRQAEAEAWAFSLRGTNSYPVAYERNGLRHEGGRAAECLAAAHWMRLGSALSLALSLAFDWNIWHQSPILEAVLLSLLFCQGISVEVPSQL